MRSSGAGSVIHSEASRCRCFLRCRCFKGGTKKQRQRAASDGHTRLADDAQLGSGERDPLGGLALPLFLGPALDNFLTPVPDHLTAVERTVEHLADATWRPAPTTWRGDMLFVQPVRDGEHPNAVRVQLKDAPDDCGFRCVNGTGDT